MAAIAGGSVFGSIFAIPAGLLIDLLVGHNATGHPWDITTPNVVYSIVIAFLTGFFAGLIFRRRGKLIGALAQVVPAVVIISLTAIGHVSLKPVMHSSPLFWMTLGLTPAVVAGSYGERVKMRSLAKPLSLAAKLFGGLFFAISLLAGLVLFFYYWQVLAFWLGGVFGTLVAFVVSSGVVLFPFIYWLVERAFPTSYFQLLGVGLLAVTVGELLWKAASKLKQSRLEEEAREGIATLHRIAKDRAEMYRTVTVKGINEPEQPLE